MPIISQFLGITVRMYFGDHPPPHIHVVYSGFEALVDIRSGDVIRGSLPRRVERLIQEWIEKRTAELEANWSRAEALEPLERIGGLDDD